MGKFILMSEIKPHLLRCGNDFTALISEHPKNPTNKPHNLVSGKTKRVFLINKKKAQAWSIDLLIACFIFGVALTILYTYGINYSPQSKNNLNELFYQGNLAGEMILSEDGIISEGKINQTKLDEFASADYQEKKIKMGLKDNFYFSFENLKVNGVPVDYVGKMNETEIEDVVQVERISVYENKPIKFDIYLWN